MNMCYTDTKDSKENRKQLEQFSEGKLFLYNRITWSLEVDIQSESDQ